MGDPKALHLHGGWSAADKETGEDDLRYKWKHELRLVMFEAFTERGHQMVQAIKPFVAMSGYRLVDVEEIDQGAREWVKENGVPDEEMEITFQVHDHVTGLVGDFTMSIHKGVIDE